MGNLKDKKILIVDDEPEIRIMIERFLRKEGFFRIYTAADCASALSICGTGKPDIVILDIMLPDGDGFSLLSSIRQFSDTPVLFLSARGEDEDRLLGLGLGADDYIVKPFLPRELVLRLMAILKRVYSSPVAEHLSVFQLGELTIDLDSAVVHRNQKDLPLTAKEHAILVKMYENQGRIVTSDALCQAVWGDDSYGYENTLMVHIRRVREKIELDPSKPLYLLTVRGLGYKLLVKETR
ncbi:response regulator transcription factor [Brevibacillus laterosporus]|uniref:DNA-binding response regulator n=1 Tax=Brevibacillus laterosporus TaxID=1465 RepID=A0AAP3DHP9_BRELA|nr:response regulator transcription factor [Brevibacillus laterosporus]MCR8980891.1 response regulator transcription factor [Brevibacillus laterosporus]MCZ0808046.1 response regulator transcription factor [Brevibacillus laterosporus]MCZ0828936.1 response regulator transcription factor [Brevibacillus laterosporus]MCZ0852474.1 response regulator transcription factor [Brevibacillus laterosporus]PPA90189.1 DNA-binding response regulator [Brevibacillus laterosporus]